MRDVVPHALPLALYLGVAATRDHIPEGWLPWTYAAQALLAAGALLWFVRRGAYGELGKGHWSLRSVLPAAALGLGLGLLWPWLSAAVPLAVGEREGFDPWAFGGTGAWIALVGRVVGMVLVVPLAEELLVRSALPRLVDHPDRPLSESPVGRFTALSAAISLGFFVLTHPEWLAALVTGGVWTAWLAKTRRLPDLVVSHAVANATLVTWVLLSGDRTLW